MLTFLTAIIPAIVLIYFIYRKDKYQKEPTPQLIKGFCFGALSFICSFLISFSFLYIGFFPTEATTFWGHIRIALFGAAIPEELSKFFFLWLLLGNNKYFDEYVDGVVYAVCIGMGFAALENVGYLFQNLEIWATVGFLRALFSIPGHFFFAVMMGYFYSKAKFGDPTNKNHNISLAIVVPMALHAIFDGILMVSTTASAAGSIIFLFLGLYTYMAFTTKKRHEELLAKDVSSKRKVDDNQIA